MIAALLIIACHLSSTDDTAWTDEETPDDCAPVEADCPEIAGERSYWSACPDGDWLYVQQCLGDDCTEAEHGRVIREGWVDPWATCDAGFETLRGVLCSGC